MTTLDPETFLAPAPAPRYYIAGPMRGYARCNFAAFDAAAAVVRALGWEAVSPADHDREGGFPAARMVTCSDEELAAADFDLRAALRWDLGVLLDPATTGIVLLPGWERSTGARLEHSVATAMGLEVWRFIPGEDTRSGADTLYPVPA